MTTTTAPRPFAGRVLADLLPGDRVRDALLVGGFALLIGISAQIAVQLPFTPVPITGQTFAVLLGGAALGSGRAAAGSGLYLALGLAGVPWFAPGNGASLGYIFGFVAAAALVGALARRGADRTALRTAALMLLGNVVLYAFGVTYLAFFLGVGAGEAIALGLTPFLAGDLVKIALAVGALPLAWRMAGRR